MPRGSELLPTIDSKTTVTEVSAEATHSTADVLSFTRFYCQEHMFCCSTGGYLHVEPNEKNSGLCLGKRNYLRFSLTSAPGKLLTVYQVLLFFSLSYNALKWQTSTLSLEFSAPSSLPMINLVFSSLLLFFKKLANRLLSSPSFVPHWVCGSQATQAPKK